MMPLPSTNTISADRSVGELGKQPNAVENGNVRDVWARFGNSADGDR